MKNSVRIRVPATTANLGPGFDVLGAALSLYNEVEVRVLPPAGRPLSVEVRGEGAATLPRDGRNIVWQAMRRVFERLPQRQARTFLRAHSFSILQTNHIPLVSGLGSSAAARLCGIIAANELAGRPLSDDEMIALGVRLEGHPDNIVPAFAGGLCVSLVRGAAVEYVKLAPPKLKAVVCTPDFELATKEARRVLPKYFTMSTAVFNSSRLAYLMAVLQTKQYPLLATAMEDRFHQPSREHLIPGLAKILKAAVQAGAYGAALSGAGPSVIALSSAAAAKKAARRMTDIWRRCNIESRVFVLDFDSRGVQIR